MKNYIKNNNVFVIILLFNLFFVLYLSKVKSLWIDEFFSWAIANRPLLNILSPHSNAEYWYRNSFPPLYEIIVKFFIIIFKSDSQLVLRLPSVIFYLLLLCVVYGFVNKITGKLYAILAVFMISVSAIGYNFASMCRGYMFFSFLTTLSYVFLYFILVVDNKKYILHFTVTQALMMYVTPLSFIIIFLEDIWFVIWLYKLNKLSFKDCFYLFLPIFFFLPWIYNFGIESYTEMLSWRNTGNSLFNAIEVFAGSILVYSHRLFAVYFVLFILSVFIFMNMKIGVKYKTFFMLSLLFVFIYIVIVLYIAKDKNVLNTSLGVRYFVNIVPLFAIITSVALSNLNRMVVLLLLPGIFIFARLDAECLVYAGIRDVAFYVKKNIDSVAADKIIIVFFDNVDLVPGFVYYFRGSDMALKATRKYYGNLKKINKEFKSSGSNVRIVGNYCGRGLYLFNKAVYSRFTKRIILVDSCHFSFINIKKGNPCDLIPWWRKYKPEKFEFVCKKSFPCFNIEIYDKKG